MSTVQTPDPDDTRITDNDDFRDGYCRGFLDALAVVKAATGPSGPVEPDGGFAKEFLERQRQARRELRTAASAAVAQESAR